MLENRASTSFARDDRRGMNGILVDYPHIALFFHNVKSGTDVPVFGEKATLVAPSLFPLSSCG